MSRKTTPAAPPAAPPRETLVVTEGITTVIEPKPTPAAPEPKENEDAEDTGRTAREG